MYWPRLVTALAIAAQVWGVPACGSPAVKFTDSLPTGIDASADLGGCWINLRKQRWWSKNPEMRCTTIVHEWGHLAGFGHSDDPTNVMHAPPTKRYWRCVPPRERWELR